MDGITVIIKHEFGDEELVLDKEIVNAIAIDAAKENITFEKKFNQLLQDQAEEMFKLEQELDIPHKDRYYNKDNDEKSDTTKIT